MAHFPRVAVGATVALAFVCGGGLILASLGAGPQWPLERVPWLPWATTLGAIAAVVIAPDEPAPSGWHVSRRLWRWLDTLLFLFAFVSYLALADDSGTGDRERIVLDALSGVVFLKAEPLSASLVYGVGRIALAAELAITSLLSLVMAVAGAAGTVVARRLAFAITRERTLPGLVAFAAIASAPAAALFFAHVENYTVPAVILMAALVAGLRSLDDGGNETLAVGLWALACAFHMQMLCAGPAFAYLVWKRRRQVGATTARLAPWVLGLALLQVVCLMWPPPYPQHYGGDEAMLVAPTDWLTASRWRDLVNLVAFGMAGALVAVPAAAHRSTATPRERFLYLVAAGWLLFTLLWNPDLGARNDWDLFAALGFWAMAAVLAPLLGARPTWRHLAIAGAAALINLARTVPFVMSNHQGT